MAGYSSPVPISWMLCILYAAGVPAAMQGYVKGSITLEIIGCGLLIFAGKSTADYMRAKSHDRK